MASRGILLLKINKLLLSICKFIYSSYTILHQQGVAACISTKNIASYISYCLSLTQFRSVLIALRTARVRVSAARQ